MTDKIVDLGVVNKASSLAKSSHVHLKIEGSPRYKRYVPSILPGKFEKIDWKTIWRATKVDSYRYEVCADAEEEVLEENEENNCAFGTFFVSENEE